MDYAAIRDQQILAGYRADIEAFLQQNEILAQSYANAPDTLRARLAQAGAQQNLIDRIVDEVANKFRELKIADSLNRERERALKAREIIDLLDKNWGNWSVTSSGAIIFKSQDSASAFKDLNAQMNGLLPRNPPPVRSQAPTDE